MKLAHKFAEANVVKLDDKSSPSVALMRTVGGAAKTRVQDKSRTDAATASPSSPKCCMAIESASHYL